MQLFLGFDYGTQRIGVALGDFITTQANPLIVLQRDGGRLWPEITQLFEQWQPDAFVVGLPLTLDGQDQDITLLARAFADELTARFDRRVFFSDERYSSQQAESLHKQHPNSRKFGKDSLAAQIILQSWLQNPPSGVNE